MATQLTQKLKRLDPVDQKYVKIFERKALATSRLERRGTRAERRRTRKSRIGKPPPSLHYPRDSDSKQCYKNICREFYHWERAFEGQLYHVRKRQLGGAFDVYTAYLERSLPDLEFLQALPDGESGAWTQLVEMALHYPGSREAKFFVRHDEIMLGWAKARFSTMKGGKSWDFVPDVTSLAMNVEKIAIPSLCPRTIGYMLDKMGVTDSEDDSDSDGSHSDSDTNDSDEESEEESEESKESVESETSGPS